MSWPADDRLRRRCSACGTTVDDPARATCPARRAGDDIDHLLEAPDPPGPWPPETPPADAAANPFLRYRSLSWSWRVALAGGLTDGDYVELVDQLDRAVAVVDRPAPGVGGHGFRPTPLGEHPGLARALGLGHGARVLVKDETGDVSGSHKARHLMGLMIHLRVLERLGLLADRSPLAIASCGNAALGAAVVAAAADWPLEVYVPPAAPPTVLGRLESLGTRVWLCPRSPGQVGDPCYLRFRAAVEEGALPFAAQGPENGLTLEGGATLGYELADQLPGAADRLYLQVGGGALAASVMLGLRRAVDLGQLVRLPRLTAVQSGGAAPLARAHRRALSELARRRPGAGPWSTGDIDAVLGDLARRRHQAMWPWEREPRSVATGILDDETYDWRQVVAALLRTGGEALVVEESDLLRAHQLARDTVEVDTDPTGSAGLAGLVVDARQGRVGDDETVVVVLTGATRR